MPSDDRADAFGRTPTEVLRIVYLIEERGKKGGGFDPDVLNGNIRIT